MGFLDNFLTSIYDSTIGLFTGGLQTLGDSLGITQHGRDQYFAREMQRDAINSQIEAQERAQSRNFDFSREMYNTQLQDTLKHYPEFQKMASDAQFNLWLNQFNAQNAYNSPASQVNRMMAAGLNPSGGTQSVATSNMGASSVSPPPIITGSPLGGNVSPVGLPQGLSANGAELRNIGAFLRDVADMKKIKKETIGQELENEYKQRSLNDRVAKHGLENKWTQEQIALTQQQYGEIVGRLNLMRLEGELSEKQLSYFDEKMAAEINNLKQSAEYHRALAGLTDEQKELLSAMFDDLKNYQMYSTQQMEKFVNLLSKYGDAQAIVGMLSQVVNSAVDVIELFKPKVSNIIHSKK